jgi:hypothetical protein
MQSLLLLLFVWLLGLLAPAIQDRIRQKYRAAELRNAITLELNVTVRQLAKLRAGYFTGAPGAVPTGHKLQAFHARIASSPETCRSLGTPRLEGSQ